MSSSYFAGLPLAGNAPEVSFDTTITHAHGCTPVYPLSGGWTRYVHINGGVYYYHAELRVITERDVSETGDQNIVLEDWKDFLQSTRDNGMIRYVTSDADAVLRYLPSLSDSGEYDGELELAEAFFVCYSDASEVKCPRAGKEDISVQHDTYSYWTHIEEYPMHLHKQRSGVLSKATACFWTAITFLSNARTFEVDEFVLPFTSEQIERVVEVYEDLLDTWETNQTMTPVLIWYLARIIREVKAMQEGIAMAVGYHSQTEIQGHSGYAIKQLSSTIQQSIRETGKASTSISGTWQLSTAEVLFSVLLLSTHRSYRERLAKTRVAWSVNLEEFRHVIEKMLAEWTDTNLLATVFVGANVSFLSVPNLTAMQRTASLASAIFSLVSIGSGLYHVWHHRTKIRADQVDAAKYVYHVQGPGGRGESDMVDPVVMSFFLAVPVASMLWAVACFSVALAAFCIQGTDSHGRIVLIVVIGVGTTVSLLAALGFKQMHFCTISPAFACKINSSRPYEKVSIVVIPQHSTSFRYLFPNQTRNLHATSFLAASSPFTPHWSPYLHLRQVDGAVSIHGPRPICTERTCSFEHKGSTRGVYCGVADCAPHGTSPVYKTELARPHSWKPPAANTSIMVFHDSAPIRACDANDLAQEIVGHCMSFLDPARDRASLEACSLVSKSWSEESSRRLFARFKPRLTGDLHALITQAGASERVRKYARCLDLRPPPYIYTVGEVPRSVHLELQDLLQLMSSLPNLQTVSLRAINVTASSDTLSKPSKYRGFKLETLELSDVWNLTNCRRPEFRAFWGVFDDIRAIAVCNSTEPPADINDGPITQLARPLPRVTRLRISAMSSPHVYIWLKHHCDLAKLKILSISAGVVRFDQGMLYNHNLFAACTNLEDVMFDVQMPYMAVYRERYVEDYGLVPPYLSLPRFNNHQNLRIFRFSGLSAFPDVHDGRLIAREQLLWQDLLSTIKSLSELRVLCFHVSSRTDSDSHRLRGTLADWHWARLGRVLDGHKHLQRIFILDDVDDDDAHSAQPAVNPWSYYRDWVVNIVDALPVRLLPIFGVGVYFTRSDNIYICRERQGVPQKIVISPARLARIAERSGPWRDELDLSG